MLKDFSIEIYTKLLNCLQKQAFSFVPFNEFIQNLNSKSICLRHDVDLLPYNSMVFANIQHELGIKGSYYFRAVKESWNEQVIKKIHNLGHEIGYHYENLSTSKGDSVAAIKDFATNLDRLQKLVPVSTICMHGSPRSPHDSKDLWKFIDYCDYDLVAEPYFDVDFSEVLYLTDTGRRWNGEKVSVRDGLKAQRGRREEQEIQDPFSDWIVKPKVNSSMNMSQEAIDFQNKYRFRSTFDIIETAKEGRLPDKIMMTFHPQRWTDKPGPWMKELLWQNSKNVVKYFLIKLKN